MESYSMFPSMVIKTRIDPDSYDKEALIKAAMEGYEKDPNKNYWDTDSDLHHYYGTMFDCPKEIESLSDSYAKAIDEYMDSLDKSWHSFEYRWKMVNLAVNSRTMAPHDHFYKAKGWQGAYSCIHYISYDRRDHSSTKFLNPLVFAQYLHNTHSMSNLLNKSDIDNSAYFEGRHMDIHEDDMIIFPTYLKHMVSKGIKRESDKPRILGVANIDLKIGE